MLPQSLCWCLQIEKVADMMVCRFTGRDLILDEPCVQSVREHLDQLIDEDRHRKLVLDFSNVAFLSSVTRNVLILLHKRLKALGGWLIICKMSDQIREIFEITKLNTILDIRLAEPRELSVAC